MKILHFQHFPMGMPGARPIHALIGVAVVLMLAACEEPGPPEPEAPRSEVRVVSLTPLASRFVIALGAHAQLVAVDAASAGLPALRALPVVGLDEALALEPDLILLPALPEAPEEDRRAGGTRLVSFAPHDLEDVAALVRDVGVEVAGVDAVERFERAHHRPLARVGGESRGKPRPRVAAVVGFTPLEIAGGHSFDTDLIEIAGGSSITHTREETRIPVAADQWSELAPDLILVVSPNALSPAEQKAARNALPAWARVTFFHFDRDFWLDADPAPAQRLRALIEPLSRAMQKELSPRPSDPRR